MTDDQYWLRHAVFLLFGLSALSAAACQSVLGIEEATAKPSDSTSSSAGGPGGSLRVDDIGRYPRCKPAGGAPDTDSLRPARLRRARFPR